VEEAARVMVHLAVRMLPGLDPLADPERARWLWGRLRVGFPGALAAALMPGHLHLVALVESVSGARSRLARTLGWWSRRYPVAKGFRQWEPVPEPRRLVDRKHLRRTLRYVGLNPCRDRLASDPLTWVWSTHREVCGAVVDPWVTGERVASALGEGSRGFARRWHAYVSADPSVAVDGTPFPASEPERRVPVWPLEDIARAAAAATRAGSFEWIRRPGVSRDLFVALCLAQGWRRPSSIAPALQVGQRMAQKLVRRGAGVESEALDAGLLCLGDERLLAQSPSRSRGANPRGSERAQRSGGSGWANGRRAAPKPARDSFVSGEVRAG